LQLFYRFVKYFLFLEIFSNTNEIWPNLIKSIFRTYQSELNLPDLPMKGMNQKKRVIRTTKR